MDELVFKGTESLRLGHGFLQSESSHDSAKPHGSRLGHVQMLEAAGEGSGGGDLFALHWVNEDRVTSD